MQNKKRQLLYSVTLIILALLVAACQPEATTTDNTIDTNVTVTPLTQDDGVDDGVGEDLEDISIIANDEGLDIVGTGEAGPVRIYIENQGQAERACELRPIDDDTGFPIFTETVAPGGNVRVESQLEGGDYFINCLRSDGTSDETTSGIIQVTDMNNSGMNTEEATPGQTGQ